MTEKEKKEGWKRIGLCSHCGKNKPVEGRIICQECLNKCKANRDYKRAHGLCVKCGRNKAAPNRKYCDECLEWRHNRYEIEKQREGYIDAAKLRQEKRAQYNKEHGLCVRCGKPIFEGRTLCYECLIKYRRLTREQRKLAKENNYGFEVN